MEMVKYDFVVQFCIFVSLFEKTDSASFFTVGLIKNIILVVLIFTQAQNGKRSKLFFINIYKVIKNSLSAKFS